MIHLRDKPTIQGEKVILRPFQSEDVQHMEEILTDPEIIKLTGSSADIDLEFVRQWYATRNEQSDRLDLVIVDRKRNLLVGEVVVNEYDEKNNSMNFRILIGPQGRNKGLGTEATQLLMEYLFNYTDLDQITLSVYAFNPRARHVYEKVGFIVESIDKNDLEYEGEWIDSINMVLTKERWLELNN